MRDRPSAPFALRPTLPAWAAVTPERIDHITRVAELASSWADEMGVPDSERNRWLRAVWLHDALRDAPEAVLEEWAASTPGPPELRHGPARWAASTPGPPELRHGPASAAMAKAEGETDRGVLDAVRYHSVGLAEWDMVGRVLYCADFLEPGRDFARGERRELAERYPDEPRSVLREVARWRISYTVSSGWALLEPTVRFWNALVS